MSFWELMGLLALATVLGILVGAEREYQGKAAGMRTHALIAAGAAMFVIAGRFGFSDAVPGTPGVDPARVAAQVVAGIGFLGAGVIFIHRNLVFGMTTAASIWVTTAVAMACAAGLPVVAIAVTGMHLAVVTGLNPVERAIARHALRTGKLRLVYTSTGALTEALAMCTREGFTVTEISTVRDEQNGERATTLTLHGRGSVADLTTTLTGESGIVGVTFEDL
ncbi:MgtC/SapB family protein [Glycomyces sp. L485]|uniref:MgtC/SapB family protein n=1 Tax=Glycomyces sp. L485 TaxID=2909235 RepID=UPI001F4A0CC7|nr:MgtC/SapB family protein [Glycomyces sp. L485]MCH7231325.1 MgtC/SapB family protein [Glycomyces sp. L485]